MSFEGMPQPKELKRFGDWDYGPYGFGYCNPAFSWQEPVTNWEYFGTIPEDDDWYEVLFAGFVLLNALFPGWRVVQIKEKFGQCRFYAEPPPDLVGDREIDDFWDKVSMIEEACDSVTRRVEADNILVREAVVKERGMVERFGRFVGRVAADVVNFVRGGRGMVSDGRFVSRYFSAPTKEPVSGVECCDVCDEKCPAHS